MRESFQLEKKMFILNSHYNLIRYLNEAPKPVLSAHLHQRSFSSCSLQQNVSFSFYLEFFLFFRQWLHNTQYNVPGWKRANVFCKKGYFSGVLYGFKDLTSKLSIQF